MTAWDFFGLFGLIWGVFFSWHSDYAKDHFKGNPGCALLHLQLRETSRISSALKKNKINKIKLSSIPSLMGVKLIFINLIKQQKNDHFFDAQISIFSLAY